MRIGIDQEENDRWIAAVSDRPRIPTATNITRQTTQAATKEPRHLRGFFCAWATPARKLSRNF